MDPLSALQQWYALACDGDWEHTHGVRMETLDNPGWALRIDVADTPLEQTAFHAITIERTQTDWISCRIEHDVFVGFGAPHNLLELIDVFVSWACSKSSGRDP
jgi:hypothetical protein